MICDTRSPGTVLRDADWPTSVRSMLPSDGPSQSSEALPDAFRNGTMKSETERPGTAVAVSAGRPVERSRKTHTPPPRTITMPIAAAMGHDFNQPTGAGVAAG